MDRQAQVEWLEEIAGDLSCCNWAGTPRELVATWEEGGNEQSALPEWYDQHDRELLVRTLGRYMAQDVATQLEDELFGEDIGYRALVTVKDRAEGWNYTPREIQVVALEHSGEVVAYQYLDENSSGAWLIGTPDDVGKCWLVYVDDED